MRKHYEYAILSCMLLCKEKREEIFSRLEENIFTEERAILFKAICKFYNEDINTVDIINFLCQEGMERDRAIMLVSDTLHMAIYINIRNITYYIEELNKIIEREKRKKELLEEYKKIKEELNI
ncbi:MAG: DnaB-like helicase N-terminal domain-containing protein [Candidatus Pacearchaeota archaeon]